MIQRIFVAVAAIALVSAMNGGGALAADWPMWRYDAGRTAATETGLPETLHLQWVRHESQRVPVWDDPLNQDLMPYDEILEPIVLGQRMFVGFNDSDRLAAFDTETGSLLWSFSTDGPVRLPAAAAADKVYFVSDDGFLYCVGADDGQLVWKFRGGPSERKIIGNERLISTWPARGGPVLRDGMVYFAASIWPFMGTFIYALDAESGEVAWINDGTGAQYLNQPHNYPAFGGIAPQGALAATSEHLLVPGGRSVPACFDRRTGEFRYFQLAPYGKSGGSNVFATDTTFFAHERDHEYSRYNAETGKRDIGVRGVRPVLADDAFYFSGESVVKRLHAVPAVSVWKVECDATGDLIKAGGRLYAAGEKTITALELGDDSEPPKAAWTIDVEGPVKRLLAAADKLFAITLDGRILAFGADETTDGPAHIVEAAVESELSDKAVRKADEILQAAGAKGGYALVYGIGDGDFLEALARRSELHLVGVDRDAGLVDQLRRRFTDSGLYGSRIALLVGDLDSLVAPAYMSSLTIINDPQARRYVLEPPSIRRVFHSLRPYGGVAWLADSAGSNGALAGAVESAGLKKAELTVGVDHALLRRVGPLPGAGVWTHQYGNIANTIKSGDELVRLPLGLLWFGGSSNLDVLPRHGHGPPEQVVGGRLFIQGMNSLSARDVYTGRVLWKVELEDLNSFGVFYDETYKDTPLSTQYNQVHIPGANARGTNFVATLDRVYIIEEDRCRVLDTATGETLQVLSLPDSNDGRKNSGWGYIGVYEDALIGGSDFAEYTSKFGLEAPEKDDRSRWRFEDYDKTASDGLVVMDRFAGDVRWRIDARYGFIHNAVTAGEGTLFCLDKMPPHLEQKQARRGKAAPDDYRLLALDIDTGDVKWEHNDNVFGTWLSYSDEYKLLLQSTRPSGDTVRSEDGKRMIVYDAATGEVQWDKEIRYWTPPILYHDRIITGGKMYHLLTGDVLYRDDPLTAQRNEWSYVSTKGCNYPIASENLLTFRSSAAAFYDLTGDGGTGHFGGFKSGCTSNLVAADGVLNAPDYTRTCSCSFQNQTSLALVHMPEIEIWTHNDFGYNFERVQRVGVNFGAPGDRRDESGTLWLDHPRVGGPSPEVHVAVEGSPEYFRRHSSQIEDGDLKWVAGSGVEGASRITVRLAPNELHRLEAGVTVAGGENDAEENDQGEVNLSAGTYMLSVEPEEKDDENEAAENEKKVAADGKKIDGQVKNGDAQGKEQVAKDQKGDSESDAETADQQDRKPPGQHLLGLRFPSLSIPPGSKITSASVQFKADDRAFKKAVVAIRGQAADDAPPFEAKSRDLSSRDKTETTVDWEVPLWPNKRVAGPEQRTPDLAGILQEIVDRPGWKKGGAIALIFSGRGGTREVDSFEGDRGKGPQLIVHVQEPPSLAEARSEAPKVPYTVRLHFLEPDRDVQEGDRVFDVSLQGETVLEEFDVLAEAQGRLRTVVRTFTGVPVAEELYVSLSPKSSRPAVLCGIELIADENR